MLSLQVLLGRVCTIAGLHKKDLPVAVRAHDKAQYDYCCSSGRGVDYAAEEYLRDLLKEIKGAGGGELVPLTVEVTRVGETH